MQETLEALELERTKLYQQLQALGDFRPGIISVNFRKCGKKNCACARAGHAGHGPQYLWNTTQRGQSRAQNLHMGAELGKVRTELENHTIFLGLCQQLVEVNEKICQLRPVQEVKDKKELEALKKKLQKQFSARWHKK
jgi:uncharacterized protein DUF6788